MTLPIYKSDSEEMSLMQTRWASILDPIIKNPAVKSIILKDVQLVSGTNAVNHRLGRALQGWNVVRQKSAASLYDDQDNNSMPALTLILISSADVIVSLEVF